MTSPDCKDCEQRIVTDFNNCLEVANGCKESLTKLLGLFMADIKWLPHSNLLMAQHHLRTALALVTEPKTRAEGFFGDEPF